MFVYFGFLCLQVSSVSNFSPDTRGRRWSFIYAHLFNCTVGREEHCKQISLACVGSACSIWATLGLLLLTGVCAFSVYAAQSPGCSAEELSKAGPGLHALPRSKLLRFRFSGTPQRHRLCWACVLCPSQVREAQATRCLVSTHSPGGVVCLITSPVPVVKCPVCAVGAPSQVCHVSPLGS